MNIPVSKFDQRTLEGFVLAANRYIRGVSFNSNIPEAADLVPWVARVQLLAEFVQCGRIPKIRGSLATKLAMACTLLNIGFVQRVV